MNEDSLTGASTDVKLGTSNSVGNRRWYIVQDYFVDRSELASIDVEGMTSSVPETDVLMLSKETERISDLPSTPCDDLVLKPLLDCMSFLDGVVGTCLELENHENLPKPQHVVGKLSRVTGRGGELILVKCELAKEHISVEQCKVSFACRHLLSVGQAVRLPSSSSACPDGVDPRAA